jgi:hypothetical protein
MYTLKNSYPCNRPSRPIGLWDVEAPTFYLDNRFTDGGKVVSLRRRPPFTHPRRFLVLISVRGCVDSRAIVRLEGLGQLKKKSTSSGPEPATFRLVAWCLNQLRYRVPPYALKLFCSRSGPDWEFLNLAWLVFCVMLPSCSFTVGDSVLSRRRAMLAWQRQGEWSLQCLFQPLSCDIL